MRTINDPAEHTRLVITEILQFINRSDSTLTCLFKYKLQFDLNEIREPS